MDCASMMQFDPLPRVVERMLHVLNKKIEVGGLCDRELFQLEGNTAVIPPLALTVFLILMVIIAVALLLT
jgi:hypothetical protein